MEGLNFNLISAQRRPKRSCLVTCAIASLSESLIPNLSLIFSLTLISRVTPWTRLTTGSRHEHESVSFGTEKVAKRVLVNLVRILDLATRATAWAIDGPQFQGLLCRLLNISYKNWLISKSTELDRTVFRYKCRETITEQHSNTSILTRVTTQCKFSYSEAQVP